MGNCMRQPRVPIGLACRRDSIQRLFHRAVADRMHVNDQTLFVGRDTQLGKFLRLKQQIAIPPRVSVWLAEMRRL